MPSPDHLQTFSFENTDIRGCIVSLSQSFEAMLAGHDYSSSQRSLLAQFVAANVLMSSHLKYDGQISIQAQGKGSVSLVMSESTSDLHYRAVIRGDSNEDFGKLFQGGALAINLEPDQGYRYQGVVPLEKATVAECLADYFIQSEQLETWFFLGEYQGSACGLLLQALPPQQCLDPEERKQDWERIIHLASTITTQEIAELPLQEVLYRLFHEETVRLHQEKPVIFQCSCSRERTERALLSLGKQELLDIAEEEGAITTECHFCNKSYSFTKAEILHLAQSGSAGTMH